MRIILLLAPLLFLPFLVFPQDEIRISVTEFDPLQLDESDENPTWSELRLPRRDATAYSLFEDDSLVAIRAESMNSASGLVYKVDIDPAEFPILEWSWRVDEVVEGGNYKSKKGDDYAARIYITFDYDRRNLKLFERVKYETFRTFSRFPIPIRAINYIWANQAEVGTIAPNAYTNWVYMIAVESGQENTGIWRVQTQNVYDDYISAFGEQPPRISGIAIMSDTDNTKGSAVAFYGDIIFRKAQ